LGFTHKRPERIFTVNSIQEEEGTVVRFCFGFSLAVSILATIAAAQPAQQRPATRALPPETINRLDQLHASLQPSVRNWVDEQARSAVQRHSFNVPSLRSSVQQRFPSLNAAGSEGSVLGLLALIMKESISQDDAEKKYYLQQLQDLNTVSQAITDQLNDLARATGEQAQQGNQGSQQDTPDSPQKSATCATILCRSLPSRLANLNAISARTPHPLHLQAPANPTYADLQKLKANLKEQLNSVNDISQLQQEKLQEAEQDYSQAVSTISAIEKQMNDSSESIIRNLK